VFEKVQLREIAKIAVFVQCAKFRLFYFTSLKFCRKFLNGKSLQRNMQNAEKRNIKLYKITNISQWSLIKSQIYGLRRLLRLLTGTHR